MKEPLLVLRKEMVVDHIRTGALVKDYRVSLGLSQEAVAAELGQDYPTIVSDLERGKRVWNQAKLVRVLDAIHKSVGKTQ